MTIKLNEKQVNYLDSALFKERPDFLEKLQRDFQCGSFYLSLDNDTADEIRDWAGDQIQCVGFDSNYELTSEGEILESLIDILYIE